MKVLKIMYCCQRKHDSDLYIDEDNMNVSYRKLSYRIATMTKLDFQMVIVPKKH